jgi:hypothetical protein
MTEQTEEQKVDSVLETLGSLDTSAEVPTENEPETESLSPR